ncbi:MAG: transglutaminase domain-containing protein, partial [Bacteroidota bacterium]
RQTGGFLDDVIHPLSADMMTAEGSCGSYSAVLCRLLNTIGFTTRFAQMKVAGKYGGHIIVEAKTNHGWVVLDPSFNVSFTKPGGPLAGFNDVSANWALYTKQLPAGYNLLYNYQAVRYTNWNKIPVVMPAIRKVLSLFLSEKEIREISLRNYFLNKYEVCGNILLLLIFPLSFIIIIKKTGYRFSFKSKLRRINLQLVNDQQSHASA